MTDLRPAADLTGLLQRATFDTIELFELSGKFAWQQTERSLETLNEIGSEACKFWLAAMTPRIDKSRNLH